MQCVLENCLASLQGKLNQGTIFAIIVLVVDKPIEDGEDDLMQAPNPQNKVLRR